MTSLGRWLVDILNAHIERHNMPAAEPAPDTPLARFYIGQLDAEDDEPEVLTVTLEIDTTRFDEALQRATARVKSMIPRPCWACGDPAGFHAAHYCDTHFDTTGGAARRPRPTPTPPPIQLLVGIDYGFPSASTWRRT